MAMLGLMELVASQNATVKEMLEAAKYANAYWNRVQTVEHALFFNTTGKDYQDVNARLELSLVYSPGFQALHQYLAQNELLPQTPKSNNS